MSTSDWHFGAALGMLSGMPLFLSWPPLFMGGKELKKIVPTVAEVDTIGGREALDDILAQ